MITLNLLPPQEKQELRMLNIYLIIKELVFLVLFGMVLIAISLLIGKYFLMNHFQRLVDNNQLNALSEKLSLQKIKEFNSEIRNVLTIQNGFYPHAEVISQISNMAHESIFFNSLTIDGEKQITLDGIAKSREDLITLKNKMDASGLFMDFEIPLDTLFKKDNISFKLVLKLAP